MKALVLTCISIATFLGLSACTVVRERPRPSVTSTTTTEQSTFRQPSGVTTATSTSPY